MSEIADGTEIEKERKYPLEIIRGLPFPKFFVVPKVVEEVIDYKPCKNDIFIVTYPKCGTTWTQFLVWEILHNGAVPPSPNQILFKLIPYLEVRGIECIKTLPDPRVMKTHLPFHLHQYSPLAKYIHIIRNPWDCCVSFYYYHREHPKLPNLTFDEYFKLFVTGEVGYGDFFDHVLSWYSHKHEPNILFLTYEDMKKDTRATLLTIARFLGESYYETLQNETIMDDCLKHSDFEYLKKMGVFLPTQDDTSTDVEEAWRQLGEMDRGRVESNPIVKEISFFRKGVVGDWVNNFSPNQIKEFNEYLNRKLKGTVMEGFWKPVEEGV